MEQLMVKNRAIAQIKSGSRLIALICFAAAAFNALTAAAPYIGLIDYGSDQLTRFGVVRMVSGSVISAIIMVCAAAVFLRISKNGIPFAPVNILTVRVIGGLLLANAVIPMAVSLAVSGVGWKMFPSALLSSSMLAGVLFLFIAQIMYYGALLQQESDETL